jgi:hypothetical protein
MVVAVTAGALVYPAAAYAQQPPPGPAPALCQFVLGFKTLHDLASANIGDCVDNQAFASNGDAQQHTVKGLLAWRKADNWTAFTDGYQTWLNGPAGLVNRLNTQRYSWEADYNAPGIVKIVPPPPASPAPPALQPNGLTLTVAFDHNLVVPSVQVVDGSGNVTAMPAKGQWVNIYFRVRNNRPAPSALATDQVTIGDKQGRNYSSIFDLRQVDDQGQETVFPGTISPGATLLLRLTFDVAADATGGVLHIRGGNDVAAL